jgi:uroporphyrinogen-III decarboxylase
MTGRELVYRALAHDETEAVPLEVEFIDIEALRRYMPEYGEISDWREAGVKRLEFLKNAIVDVTAHQLHESPWVREAHDLIRIQPSPSSVGGGYLRTTAVEETEQYVIIQFETGGRWKLHKNPFVREYLDYPVKEEKDLEELEEVDIDDPARYQGVRESVEFFKGRGYFTSAEIYGFFSGVWYRYYYVVDYLMGLVTNKSFIKRLVDKLGEWNLIAAENYLKRGVDSIMFADDLGDRNGLLISPETYREFFFPWHRRIADLCHSYDAVCHMHSHGNINKILPLLVSAGIDLLNPLDPEDLMDLAEIKETYGKKLSLWATTKRSIQGMDRGTLERLIRERVRTGRKGGGFILHLGGISADLEQSQVHSYLDLSRQLCGLA